ncbi:MAG: NADPH:quinone oxidoreductase family protein [Cyclobacteriaceae bacterium]
MKAVLVEKIGSIDDLVLREHSLRPPRADQVLIKVEYSGVNFPDILIAKGLYQFQPELPFSPGGEVAGTIIEIGKNVKDLNIGDRVVSGTSWGGFAEEALGFASNTHKLPDEISFRDGAATLMTYGTAIHALKDRGQLQKGNVLAVLGAAGGVGSAAIQVGKQLGASVIACAGGDDKLSFCRSLGADDVVNYSKQTIKDKLKELTIGNGVDVIFDPVGGALSESSFRAIARGGRHLVLGFASGEVPAIPWNLPLLKSASIVGVFWGGFFRSGPELNAANIQLLFNWMRKGQITPTIDQVLPLDRAKDALSKLENRKVSGKVLLSCSL